MINRPGDLFAVFQKQSVENHDYDIFLKEREMNQREIDRLERKENEVEMDYYDGKMTEEKKDKLVLTTKQQGKSIQERNEVLDEKMDLIIKSEATKIALEKFQDGFQTNLENLTFEQKRLLVDLLVESVEVTTVASQLNLNIKLRFDQSKITKNTQGYEPKKSSPEPQSDNEELDSGMYGRLSMKGYLSISIYHKMRKRQYGNRWMTQFVPLCREEVRRLEENGKTIQTHIESN